MEGSARSFGPFTLFPARGELLRDGRTVPLSRRGLALLEMLIEANGAVVAKEQLLAGAWNGLVVEEGNLTVQIAALRRALGPAPDGREWIATVPRVGYRLPARGGVLAGVSGRPLVALLPFASLSSDPEHDFLARGFTNDLRAALSRFKHFAVVYGPGHAQSPAQLAEELGVRYLLEGSLQRAGDRLRLTVHLADATTGKQIWAEKFDGPAEAIFDFQDHVAEAVVGLLEPEIRRAEIERVRRKRPDNLDAYELFLKALPFVYGTDTESHAVAIGLLERAIALDRSFAPALAYAAWSYEKRITLGLPPLTSDDKARSLALASAALAEAPDDPVVMAICGFVTFLVGRDVEKGLRALRRAVAANPNDLVVLVRAAIAEDIAGDLAEASRCFRRAHLLGPGAPDACYILSGIGGCELLAGNYETAIEWGLRSLATFSDWPVTYWLLGAAYAHLGRMDEARAAVGELLTLMPHTTVALLEAWDLSSDGRWVGLRSGLRKAGLPD